MSIDFNKRELALTACTFKAICNKVCANHGSLARDPGNEIRVWLDSSNSSSRP